MNNELGNYAKTLTILIYSTCTMLQHGEEAIIGIWITFILKYALIRWLCNLMMHKFSRGSTLKIVEQTIYKSFMVWVQAKI